MTLASVDKTDALNRFFASSEQRAYRQAVIATGHRDDALDVVQDAMIKLVKYYANKPTEEWPALFQRILQTTLLDFFRRRKVRAKWTAWFSRSKEELESNNEDPMEQAAQKGNITPEDKLSQSHAMIKLDEALGALPLRQQQVFLLRQWEGYDIKETAKSMRISVGSVKKHYSRALSTLRLKLEDYYESS